MPNVTEFYSLIDTSPFPVVVVHKDTEAVEHWSRSARQLFGYTPATLGEWLRCAFPNADERKKIAAQWQTYSVQAEKTKKALPIGEYRMACEDTSYKICQLYMNRASNSLLITINDISREKEARERIEHLNSMLLAIRNITQYIAQDDDLELMMQHACDSLVEASGYPGCAISLFNETDGKVSPFASSGELTFSKDWSLSDTGKGRGPKCIKTVLTTGKITVFTPGDCKNCSYVHTPNCICAVIPMKIGGNTAGILQVIREKEMTFRREEQELLREIAGDLALGWAKVSSQRKIKESEQNYRNLAESLTNGVAIADQHTENLYVNQALADLTGYTQEELLHLRWTDIVERRHLSDLKNSIKEVMRGHKSVKHTEWNMIAKDGRDLAVDISFGATVWQGVKCIIAVIEDITENKKARQELISLKQFYENIIESVQEGIWVADEDDVVRYANKAMESIAGVPARQITGKNVLTEFPEETTKEFSKFYQKVKSNRKPLWYEISVHTPAGKDTWQNGWLIPSRVKGKFNGIICTIRDITERKQIENRLQERDELLRATGRMAKVGGWELDAETLAVSWSEETYRIHELPLDEHPPLDDAINFFHPDDRPLLEQAIQKALEHGEPYDLTLRFITAKGNNLIAHTICRPIKEHGKVVKLYGTFQDVTELRRTEQQLRESEEKFRSLANNLPNVIYRSKFDGDSWIIVFINDAIEQLTGYPSANFIYNAKRSMASIIYPDDAGHVNAAIQQAIRKKGIYELEYRAVHKNGSIIWLFEKGNPVFNQDGTLRFLDVVISDITKRKNLELSLQEAVRRQQEAVRAGNVGLWDWDLETNTVQYSDEWKRQIGYAPHEIGNTFDEWEKRVHPDDVTAVKNQIFQHIKEVRPDFQIEFRFRHKNGSYIWILATASVFADETKQPVRVIGSHVDISEQKRIQENLTTVRNELQWLLDSMINAFVIFDSIFNDQGRFISYRFVYINKAYEEITGVKNEEVKGKSVHEVWPETEPEWIKRYGEVAVTGEAQIFDMFHDPTAKTYHCHVYRPWNTPDRFCVVFEDISEVITRTNKLRDSEKRLRRLSQHQQKTQEEERARLARELHDELGQALTALRIDLSRMVIQAAGNTELLTALAEMQSVVETIDADIERIQTELRPGLLDDLGLLDALEWQVGEFEKRSGIKCSLKTSIDNSSLNQELSLTLYRIIQEAMTNIARHAEANRLLLNLQEDRNNIILTIKDNGRGVRPEELEKKGSFGLIGMRERVNLLQGEMRIEGVPGKGTTLFIKTPK